MAGKAIAAGRRLGILFPRRGRLGLPGEEPEEVREPVEELPRPPGRGTLRGLGAGSAGSSPALCPGGAATRAWSKAEARAVAPGVSPALGLDPAARPRGPRPRASSRRTSPLPTRANFEGGVARRVGLRAGQFAHERRPGPAARPPGVRAPPRSPASSLAAAPRATLSSSQAPTASGSSGRMVLRDRAARRAAPSRPRLPCGSR